MKIIFSTSSIDRGGKERQLFILARTLIDNGIQLKIVTKNITSENYINEYDINRKIISEFDGKRLIQKFRNFRQIILSDKPDLIVAWDFQTSLFSLMLYKKCQCKFINASIQHGIRLFRFSHLLRSFLCHVSPYVMANSYAGLRANDLKPGETRFILYNGIEKKFLNYLSPGDIEKKRVEFIPEYSQNPGTVYVSVANLVPYKDYFTVFKALKKFKSDKSFYYIIIGDGPMRDEVEQRIEDYGLKKRVFLTGKLENVSDCLFISDIMIHSSRGEGVSNAILEGMYAGLPVIASNVGGVQETVFSGSSLLFPYKDENALLECLRKAPVTFSGFDPRAEEYNEHLAKFSLDNMVKKFNAIIEKVMN